MGKIPTSKNVAALSRLLFLYSPPKRESRGNEMNIWSTGSTQLSSLNMRIMRLFLLSALQKRRDDNTGFSSAMSKTGWGGFPNPGHPKKCSAPRLLLGEVRGRQNLTNWRMSSGRSFGLFHHINSLEPQKVGENTSSAPLDRWNPGVDGGGDLCSAAASVKFRSRKLKARLVGKKMWWSLDFCFTSFWKLPFQRV